MTEERVPPAKSSNVEYAGPWANSATVAQYLGVTGAQLEAMRQRREVLGCTFADQRVYFPVRQFVGGKVVTGLQEVLEVLLSGIPSEQVASTWLAGPAEDGTDRTMWQQLADGDANSVLIVARQDAARWNA